MTKLISHQYDKKEGINKIVEIEVKETAKRFSRPNSSYSLTPGDYWMKLPICQLDKLVEGFQTYHMYSRQENMSRFMELVIADLERISAAKKIAYDKSLEALLKAQKVSEGKERSDENAKNQA